MMEKNRRGELTLAAEVEERPGTDFKNSGGIRQHKELRRFLFYSRRRV